VLAVGAAVILRGGGSDLSARTAASGTLPASPAAGRSPA
jgi:hypothetical protein